MEDIPVLGLVQLRAVTVAMYQLVLEVLAEKVAMAHWAGGLVLAAVLADTLVLAVLAVEVATP